MDNAAAAASRNFAQAGGPARSKSLRLPCRLVNAAVGNRCGLIQRHASQPLVTASHMVEMGVGPSITLPRRDDRVVCGQFLRNKSVSRR